MCRKKNFRYRKVKSGSLDSKELTTRLALWGGYVTNKGVDIVSEVMVQEIASLR